MKVVVPYRPGMLFRRTYDAARAWEGGCEFVELRNANEPEDATRYLPTYPELLADIWRGGVGVIMLEHDVVPYEDSLATIAYCPEPWCGYGYPNGGGFGHLGVNLGCTKLSSELIAATAEWGPLERKQRRWGQCDIRLYWYAFYLGIKAHRHYPDVAHRGTRHAPLDDEKHPLGDDYIDLDEHGEPLGDVRPPHKPLRGRARPEYMPAASYEPENELALTLGWIGQVTARSPLAAPARPELRRGQDVGQEIAQALLGRRK